MDVEIWQSYKELTEPGNHCEIGNKHIYELPEISEHRNLGHDLLYTSAEAT